MGFELTSLPAGFERKEIQCRTSALFLNHVSDTPSTRCFSMRRVSFVTAFSRSAKHRSFRQIELARYRLRRAVRNKQKPLESYMRAGFAFSGLELPPMTLSTKYQEFVSQQVKQVGSLDCDREIILWHYTNGAGLLGI
jgi:hypothetical protein